MEGCLSTLLLLLSFYLLYNTAHRAAAPPHTIRRIVQRYATAVKVMGMVLLIAAFFILSMHYGLGAGIFMGLAVLMSIACSVILFMPFVRHGK